MKINVSPGVYRAIQVAKHGFVLGGMGYGGYVATQKQEDTTKTFFSQMSKKFLPASAQESSACKACFGAFLGGSLAKMPIITASTWAITKMTEKKEIPMRKDIKIDWE